MILAPSILAARGDLIAAFDLAEKIGGKFLHIDIMDGKFVPNKTWDDSIMDLINPNTHLTKDVHIMVEKPWIWGSRFAKKGADIVTFHVEAVNLKQGLLTISEIRNNGAKPGISLKPETPVEQIIPYLTKVDLVLVMSVEPGEGGQSFIPESLEKIKAIRTELNRKRLSCWLEVDGGINAETGRASLQAGADVLVAGSYLFGHSDSKERAKALLDIDV